MRRNSAPLVCLSFPKETTFSAVGTTLTNVSRFHFVELFAYLSKRSITQVLPPEIVQNAIDRIKINVSNVCANVLTTFTRVIIISHALSNAKGLRWKSLIPIQTKDVITFWVTWDKIEHNPWRISLSNFFFQFPTRRTYVGSSTVIVTWSNKICISIIPTKFRHKFLSKAKYFGATGHLSIKVKTFGD